MLQKYLIHPFIWYRDAYKKALTEKRILKNYIRPTIFYTAFIVLFMLINYFQGKQLDMAFIKTQISVFFFSILLCIVALPLLVWYSKWLTKKLFPHNTLR